MPITGTYKIGTTYGGLTLITELTVTGYYQNIPEPKSIFYPYSELVAKDSGGFRGVGYPKAIWKWNFLRVEWRTVLRTYCTGASASVYIQTRTNEADAFATYTAVMNWPEETNLDAKRRMNFQIEFTNLVPASS